ncbi:hypothetical protein EPA93_34490 [Ktedonosporobacter rubrisoli]|uniref:Uncharacterized protein n=1 Tax=Ktedonosporobacter rubrisoli TaxID=2509675 RepID=A0A4P6JYZ6_KTERU|nr:hypothetical protein [Ktedonosporobacter rubrisoli]QBD80805.1 hypothetical protein EPA93_34490 [Ktedonosporobacter rubrisoli]
MMANSLYQLDLKNLIPVLASQRRSGRLIAELSSLPAVPIHKKCYTFAHILVRDGKPFAYEIWVNGELFIRGRRVIQALLLAGKLAWTLLNPEKQAQASQHDPSTQFPHRLQEPGRAEFMSWPRRRRQVYWLVDGGNSLARIAQLLSLPISQVTAELQSLRHQRWISFEV